jgi:hypothetical protein
MKKVIALLALLCGSLMAHADTTQTTPQAPNSTASEKEASTASTPPPAAESLGSGSGDDMTTPDEADPANDKDPEADEGA